MPVVELFDREARPVCTQSLFGVFETFETLHKAAGLVRPFSAIEGVCFDEFGLILRVTN